MEGRDCLRNRVEAGPRGPHTYNSNQQRVSYVVTSKRVASVRRAVYVAGLANAVGGFFGIFGFAPVENVQRCRTSVCTLLAKATAERRVGVCIC